MPIEKGSFVQLTYDDDVQGIVFEVSNETEPPILHVILLYESCVSFTMTTKDDVKTISKEEISDSKLKTLNNEFPQWAQHTA
jgi:hypothetical protein